jgi:hypothetical protein
MVFHSGQLGPGMAAKSMVMWVEWREDRVDKREKRSRGGAPSSNTPTTRSWRLSHRMRDTVVNFAGK